VQEPDLFTPRYTAEHRPRMRRAVDVASIALRVTAETNAGICADDLFGIVQLVGDFIIDVNAFALIESSRKFNIHVGENLVVGHRIEPNDYGVNGGLEFGAADFFPSERADCLVESIHGRICDRLKRFFVHFHSRLTPPPPSRPQPFCTRYGVRKSFYHLPLPPAHYKNEPGFHRRQQRAKAAISNQNCGQFFLDPLKRLLAHNISPRLNVDHSPSGTGQAFRDLSIRFIDRFAVRPDIR